jgi:hypothetical protein
MLVGIVHGSLPSHLHVSVSGCFTRTVLKYWFPQRSTVLKHGGWNCGPQLALTSPDVESMKFTLGSLDVMQGQVGKEGDRNLLQASLKAAGSSKDLSRKLADGVLEALRSEADAKMHQLRVSSVAVGKENTQKKPPKPFALFIWGEATTCN